MLALEGITPAQQLRELLTMGFAGGLFGSPMDWPVKLLAAEVQAKLTARDAATATQARALLRGPRLVGRYLGELAGQNPELVEKLKLRDGKQFWLISDPNG